MNIKAKMLIPELILIFIFGAAILVSNIVLFSGFVYVVQNKHLINSYS